MEDEDTSRERALQLYQRGLYEQALPLLRALALQEPSDIELALHLASALAMLERFEEALPAVRLVLAAESDSSLAHRLHSQVLDALGRREEALDAAREAVRSDPTDTAAWRRLAFAARQCALPAESLRAAQRAVEIDPDDVEAWQAIYHAALGRDQRLARNAIQCALALDEGNPILHLRLGNLLPRGSERNAAYRRAIELDPSFAVARRNLAYELVAREPAEAMLQARAALQLGPNDVDSLICVARVGVRANAAGEAWAAIAQAEQLAPSRIDVWRAHAFIGGILGDRDALIAGYRKAHELDPDDDDCLSGLARALHDRAQGVKLLEELAKRQPSSLHAALCLVGGLCEVGRYLDASAVLARCLQTHPTQLATIYERLALTAALAKDASMAAPARAFAARLSSAQQHNEHELLAHLARLDGDWERAKVHYRAGLGSDARCCCCLLGLSLVELEAGNVAGAKATYEDAKQSVLVFPCPAGGDLATRLLSK